MRKLPGLGVYCLAFGALSAPLSAVHAAEAFTFDKSHTQIIFSYDHLGFSTTQGMFRDFDGSITIDSEEPANSSVSVTIQADSIDTGWPERDAHLRSAEFFDVEQFPTITFESTEVRMAGVDQAIITGNLTIRDQTREVELVTDLVRMGLHPMREGVTAAGFGASTTVKRSDYGLGLYAPAVGDVIDIRISAETVSGAE